MASQDEQAARQKWGPEKCAAFDRQMAAFWSRAVELAEADAGADVVQTFRFSRGAYLEGHFDRDERFS